jgi:hypothetical protein
MWIRSFSFIKNMKNVLFNIKSVITGSSKAVAGAGSGAKTFWKSEPGPEQKQIVSAPQHWEGVCMCGDVYGYKCVWVRVFEGADVCGCVQVRVGAAVCEWGMHKWGMCEWGGYGSCVRMTSKFGEIIHEF